MQVAQGELPVQVSVDDFLQPKNCRTALLGLSDVEPEHGLLLELLHGALADLELSPPLLGQGGLKILQGLFEFLGPRLQGGRGREASVGRPEGEGARGRALTFPLLNHLGIIFLAMSSLPFMMCSTLL